MTIGSEESLRCSGAASPSRQVRTRDLRCDCLLWPKAVLPRCRADDPHRDRSGDDPSRRPTSLSPGEGAKKRSRLERCPLDDLTPRWVDRDFGGACALCGKLLRRNEMELAAEFQVSRRDLLGGTSTTSTPVLSGVGVPARTEAETAPS